VIYTDGACKGNPGPGGWGALLMFDGREKELFGGELATTNNRMELTAVIRALEALKRGCDIELYVDSQYVKNGMETWIRGWKKNGWRTSDRKPVRLPADWSTDEVLQLLVGLDNCDPAAIGRLSEVITRPVTPAILPKISTWLSAFCPTVASRTSSTACGAAGSTLRMTRNIFSSSPISSLRFCKRPAVSISTTSMPSALAAVTASKARLAASAPGVLALMLAPVRVAQIFN